jgi:DNA-binding MarR family transcriptional regulator
MEKAVMRRRNEGSDVEDAKKLLIMRTLAEFHGCDAETLCSRIDASELDVHDVLREMVSTKEVEVSPRPLTVGKRSERFALTLKGRAEYMKVLASIYELPE